MEYSAHLLPEGGPSMVPRLSTGGFLLAGDAAGLCYTNGLTFEGMNLAMASGDLAADVAVEALGAGDVSAQRLAGYEQRLRDSFVMKDLGTWGRATDFLRRDQVFSLYPAIVGELMESIYRSDGRPKRRIGRLAVDAVRGKVPLGQLIRDGHRGGEVVPVIVDDLFDLVSYQRPPGAAHPPRSRAVPLVYAPRLHVLVPGALLRMERRNGTASSSPMRPAWSAAPAS